MDEFLTVFAMLVIVLAWCLVLGEKGRSKGFGDGWGLMAFLFSPFIMTIVLFTLCKVKNYKN